MPTPFFEEQSESSRIKADIVSKYFFAWANIVLPWARDNKIGYIDLFSGPGEYDDGKISTPLLILQNVAKTPKLADTVVSIMQDESEEYIEILKKAVSKIDGIANLRHTPVIQAVKTDEQVIKELEKINKIPSIIFIDPFGYSGLSVDLIRVAIKDWGCDCIFFFNYNRINSHLSNPVMVENMNSFFGRDVADKLRKTIIDLSPKDREREILKQLTIALEGVKGKHNARFKFYQLDSDKTSHYIYLTTKSELGYGLMKEIMALECDLVGGIPSYKYYPKTNKFKQTELFADTDSGIIELSKDLMTTFKGQKIKMLEVYSKHQVGKPYIKDNYKKALLLLESESKITVDKPANERPKRYGQITLGDDRVITFP